MSLETAISVMGRVTKDEHLEARVATAVEGKKGREAADAIVGVGNQEGYDFTADEFIKARAGLRQKLIEDGVLKDVELSEAELEAVAGGITSGGIMVVPGASDLYSHLSGTVRDAGSGHADDGGGHRRGGDDVIGDGGARHRHGTGSTGTDIITGGPF